mgnify:CR=1 FL=1
MDEYKYWTPKLIELTQIGCPDFANGETTKCFVDVRLIGFICASIGAFNKRNPETPGDKHPDQQCTTIWLTGGGPSHCLVLETPEEVALRRDRALELPVSLKGIT